MPENPRSILGTKKDRGNGLVYQCDRTQESVVIAWVRVPDPCGNAMDYDYDIPGMRVILLWWGGVFVFFLAPCFYHQRVGDLFLHFKKIS